MAPLINMLTSFQLVFGPLGNYLLLPLFDLKTNRVFNVVFK